MDSTTLGSEKRACLWRLPVHDRPCDRLRVALMPSFTVEFATLTLDAEKRPKAKIYKPAEIDALLVKHDLAKKDEDAEMRAA